MQSVLVPHEFVNDESVLLLDWLVADGEQVEAGRPLATVETSKATFSIDAPSAGYVRYNLPKQTEVKVGGLLCYIAASAGESIPVAEQAVTAGDGQQNSKTTRFSQKARVLLQQHGLSEELFAGRGLVTANDVLKAVDGDQARVPEAPVEMGGIPVHAEELSRQKRTETKYLAAGGQNALRSFVSMICPTRGLKSASLHAELGGSALPMIIYEAARLLRKYPVFNAFHHEGQIQYYESVNVGFAIDADRGLKVPVIADTDKKAIGEIAREMEDLALAYLNDALPVKSLAGGTFTITDLSGEEVHLFEPLINQRQSAILGIGAEYFPPGGREGVFNLMLAFDHRLAEGRAAARFLKDLRERIASYEAALGNVAARAGEEPCCARCLRPASELARLQVPLLQELRPDGQTAAICAHCVQGW